MTVPERLDRLNNAANHLWRRFDRKIDALLFTITLQSHLALRNDGGEPVLDEANASDLALPPEATRCRSLLQAVAVPGWNSAINLPKPDTWALKRGSVMLFRVGARVDEQALMRRLEQIENEGLGERRAEGFGRVLVCDPFHYCFLERELHGG
jgi:CRISPR-associated protein Csx10